MFLRLRILEGVPASWVEDDRAEPFLESGLLTEDDGSLVPTERGMLLLNELVLGLDRRPARLVRREPSRAPGSPASDGEAG